MLEPVVTLTDYALSIECAVFSFLMLRQSSAGDNRALSTQFGALFLALALASALGGTYHGFFSAEPGIVGKTLWLMTLWSVGLVTFFTWLTAAEIQLATAGKRVILWVATIQLIGFSIYVAWIARDFLIASVSTLPSMLFLFIGYLRVLHRHASIRVWAGLAGLLLAFVGVVLQQMGVGLHEKYFNHNSVYHVFQFLSFALIYLSIRGLKTASMVHSAVGDCGVRERCVPDWLIRMPIQSVLSP